MAFMEPEYFEGPYAEFTNPDTCESFFVPAEFADDTAGMWECHERTDHKGILSRLSAPGYMDCTDWTPYATEEEARAAFVSDGIDPDTGEYLDSDA